MLFPEGYILASDQTRLASLRKLSSDLNTTLLVGAIDKSVDDPGRAWQVLLRFDSDGSHSRAYTKHSTAKAVAFERPDWELESALPTFDLGGIAAGATICHDHYLGLLSRSLAQRGARLWVNPSAYNVTDIKWSSVLRLRAVENRFYSLCTLHSDVNKRRTHPFGFSPDGAELSARPAGSKILKPLSECCEAGKIYVVDLDMSKGDEPLDWSKLPPATKPKRPRKGQPKKPIRVALKGGQPSVPEASDWNSTDSGVRIEFAHGPVYVGLVPEERILDSSSCFQVLDHASKTNCAPVIWNHWGRLPADSSRLATLMQGRAVECCAPIVLSDKHGIHELVELSNKLKIPVRRVVESSGEVIVDVQNAWGMRSAFRMVTKYLPPAKRGVALEHYRTLC